MDHDGRKWAQDKHKLASSLPYSISASASMVNYGLVYEAEDFGPFETLYCKFHKRIGSWLEESSEIKQSPLHLDL